MRKHRKRLLTPMHQVVTERRLQRLERSTRRKLRRPRRKLRISDVVEL
jgi:hypothetical protein